MHELAITEEIVALVAARAGGARVRRVVVEIGKLSAVMPDAVRFCFDLCAEGTPLEGAVLDLVLRDGLASCNRCGATVRLERPYGRCDCGCSDLDWISGEELNVREMEID